MGHPERQLQRQKLRKVPCRRKVRAPVEMTTWTEAGKGEGRTKARESVRVSGGMTAED